MLINMVMLSSASCEILHVNDTSVMTLKAAIDVMFATHELRILKMRGQGYDRASNIRGSIDLKLLS